MFDALSRVKFPVVVIFIGCPELPAIVMAPVSAQVILFVPPAFKIASPVPTPSRTKLLFVTDN